MATTIKHCKCRHTWQDQIHGDNLRVHNSGGGNVGRGNKPPIWRCTVCLATSPRGESVKG